MSGRELCRRIAPPLGRKEDPGMKKYAGVYLLDAPFSIDREYDYRIPEGMQAAPGDFLSVPFGNGNRRAMALCTSVRDASETPEDKIKPIAAVMTRAMSLDAEMLGLCLFMKEQTLCTVGEAVHAMLPPAALSRLGEFYLPNPARPLDAANVDAENADPAELMLLDFIKSRGRVSAAALNSRFGAGASESAERLCRGKKPFLIKELEPVGGDANAVRACAPAPDADTVRRVLEGAHPEIKRPRSPVQVKILEMLVGAGEDGVPETAIEAETGGGRSQLTALEKKGLLRRILVDASAKKEVVGTTENTEMPPMRLNDEQSRAFEVLSGLTDDKKPHGALLYGVTGSGKTAVMLALIDRLLAEGRGVILLLPEIALTPQTVRIFCSRYGARVAVLHSGLSRVERCAAWERIKSGAAPLAVGTRSAVFAPVVNLGMIIIDEEQEHTYKSDMSPRYHARDIARYRAAHAGALMLLCSATPSVESFKKAEDGKYTLVRLTHRYGGAELPAVTVADMRGEARGANLSPIGTVLSEKLRETVARGEQAILFLNRRGYNTFVSCASCGEAISCPRCSVSMTYHTRGSDYGTGELVCHWCGRHMPLPEKCPNCGSEHLVRMGYGTQRVEQELGMLIPGVRVIRMDTDTTSTREAYDKMLGSFRAHEADILLGTQMVTKGHDFPDVTLVGVLLADMSLYLDDYRAGERTFAMLTQVIGRAGRAGKPGEAIIQTNNPEHDIIKLACSQDYDTFYSREIRLRRALTFPPFCDIVLMTVTSPDEMSAVMSGKALAERLRAFSGGEYRDVPVIVFGPFEAPVYRVDGKYRIRMVIKCKLSGRSRAMFARLRTEFSDRARRGPTLAIDFNPTNI